MEFSHETSVSNFKCDCKDFVEDIVPKELNLDSDQCRSSDERNFFGQPERNYTKSDFKNELSDEALGYNIVSIKEELTNELHENSDKKPEQCKFCEYVTDATDDMERHIEVLHREHRPNQGVRSVRSKKKTFECHMCGYRCSRKYSLAQHIESVHLKLKKFQCNHCDYRCNQKFQLTQHIDSVHLNTKKFHCHFCEYRCNQKGDLKLHIDGVHLKMKKFHCHLCEYKCNQKGDLNLHIDGVHLNKNKFQCRHCEYRGNHKTMFKRHIDIHRRDYRFSHLDLSNDL